MTYIEFLDRNASENICAGLIRVPERIVLVGNDQKQLEKLCRRYHRLFEDRGHAVEFVPYQIKASSMDNIIAGLSAIVETYENCVFDLTGGGELYLVAMGVVRERYSDRNIQMHRYSIQSSTILDCDQDGCTILEGAQPQLTVEENIRIYGGDVIWDAPGTEGTVRWEDTPELRETLKVLIKLQPKDPGLWNKQADTIQAAFRVQGETENPLSVSVKMSALRHDMEKNKQGMVVARGLLNALRNEGLLTDWYSDNESFTLTCRDALVKYFLTKAGRVLEMRVYLAALDAQKDGKPRYQDVLTGVCIDWDGKLHPGDTEVETTNEIDVVMMRGMVPIFVSCKNGGVKMDELYKLNTVAQRFGGQYARKVLVVSQLDERKSANQYLVQRAKDMGIRLVKDAAKRSKASLIAEVCKF